MEGASDGHEVFLIAAADTCIEVPLARAIEERYGVKPNMATGHGDFQSAFDCSKINRFFGWTPAHSRRDS